jgi:chromatin segregation and condensation protein Rec8/ScpA/Scc1 (kleisin family)
VTLWAVLELIKQDLVCVRQDHLFGQIVIQRPPRPLFAAPPTVSSPTP